MVVAVTVNSQTRGVFAGGDTPGTNGVNNIEFITIATTGNASDFGDLVEQEVVN